MLGPPEAAAPKKAGYFAFLLVKKIQSQKNDHNLDILYWFLKKRGVTPRKCRSIPPHQLRKQQKRENT